MVNNTLRSRRDQARTCFLSSFLRAISAAFSSFDIVWCCIGAGDAVLLGVGVLSDGVGERSTAETEEGCRAGVGRGFAGGLRGCEERLGDPKPRLGDEGAGAGVGALSKAPEPRNISIDGTHGSLNASLLQSSWSAFTSIRSSLPHGL